MARQNDKYEGDEDTTQVRSIIRRINEEKPSQTSKREVVVRPDGTKAIRVTKKRRVLMTEKELRSRSRKHFVMGILVVFFCLLGLAAFFFYRMTCMSGEAYVQSRVEDIRKAWGAESVRIIGSGVSGTTFHISSVVAEFPDSCIIEQIELSDLETELSMESFFRDMLVGEHLKVKRLGIILRPECGQMEMPNLQTEPLWKFNHMECEELSVSVGRGAQARLALRNTHARLYYPRAGRESCVIACKGGTLLIKDWQTLYVSEAKAYLSPTALEDLYLSGSVEPRKDGEGTVKSEIVLRGRFAAGESLTKPLALGADNMPFSAFTGGRFEQFFTARTVNRKSTDLLAKVAFTENGPKFSGDFRLERIMLSGFPAVTAMIEHVEPLKRRQYVPPVVEQGIVSLSENEGALTIELKENQVVSRDRLSLKGSITVHASNELSGTLAYGLPGILTRAEYIDGAPDPIFEDRGEWTWLTTALKGYANQPDDNMAEIEAQAAEARKSRPDRIQFDTLDVNKLSEQVGDSAKTESIQLPSTPKEDGMGVDPFADPKNEQDPFAPLSPF